MTPPRLALLWLAAATVRLTALALFLDHPALARLRADGLVHHAWAARIAAGDAIAGAWPTAPLFPHLLGGLYAVAGADPTVGRAFTCLVGAAAAPLAALVAARRYGAAAGWVAGGAVALYGPLVASDAALQKEGLAAVLLVGAVAAADRGPGRRPSAAAGLLLGLAGLVREEALAVAVVWALADRRRALPLLLGAALAVAPAVARNAAAVGTPTPTTGRLGPNLWLSHRPDAAVGFRTPDFWNGEPAAFDRAFADEAARRGITSWTGEALREVGRAPGRAAARAVLRLWCLVRDFPREDFAGAFAARRLVPFDLLAPVRPGLLIPLGLAGLLVLGARAPDAGAHIGAPETASPAGRAPLLALLGVFALRAVVLFPLERYRLPVAPIWAVAAAAAVVTPWTARRAAVLAAALAAAFSPAARLLDEDLHARDALERLAAVSERAGRPDDAFRLGPAGDSP